MRVNKGKVLKVIGAFLALMLLFTAISTKIDDWMPP